jgi:predicted transcriptional regulator
MTAQTINQRRNAPHRKITQAGYERSITPIDTTHAHVDPFFTRSRLSLIYQLTRERAYQILVICRDGHVSQTRLMYTARLSYFQLKKYINTLLSKGLIEETFQDGERSYQCTSRGRQFIDAFRDVTWFFSNAIH